MKVEARTPVVTLLLIATNIGAAFLLFLQPDLIDEFGFVASDPAPLQALTSLFLHANLIHLLGNMVFLAAAGPATEAAVGSLRFFGVYIAGGLLGVAAYWALSSAHDAPLIGASAAIAACVVLGAVRFNRTRVILAPSVSAPLFAIVVVWLLLQLAGSMIRLGEETGGTSYWAHVGGALAGLLLALAYKAPQEADLKESAQLMEEMKLRGPAAAIAATEKHLAAHPNDWKAWLDLAEAQSRLGEPGQATRSLLRVIDAAPGAEQVEAARRAAEEGYLSSLPSSKRLVIAERVRLTHPDLAIKILESVLIEPKDDTSRPDALLGLAVMKRDSHPDEADALIAQLFNGYPLHPAAEVARAMGWSP